MNNTSPILPDLGYKIKNLNFEKSKNYSATQSPQKFPAQEISLTEEENQINTILKTLRSRLYEIESALSHKEGEKSAIIEDINILTERLKTLNRSINKKKALYENCDKTLREAEIAYGKITESTKTLLSVVKKENSNLSKNINFNNSNS